jgi:hypothetical protein
MNTNTSLTESVVYSLKWDENGLRDKTLSEIKKDALKEITCPCRNRKYCVKNESIIRHFETNAHKEWVEIQKKEHVKEFGNCCSPEQRIEFLLKENREYKKLPCGEELVFKNYPYGIKFTNFKECPWEKRYYSFAYPFIHKYDGKHLHTLIDFKKKNKILINPEISLSYKLISYFLF